MKSEDVFNTVREIMDGWIFSIINRENARVVSRFRYLSYDWISPRGWYFWPKNRMGVYALKELPAVNDCDEEQFILALYYFPHPDEEIFEQFSHVEQMVRVSPLFSTEGVLFQVSCLLHSPDEENGCNHHDHGHMEDLKNGKGVPTIEAREELNPALFQVGYLIFCMNGKTPVRLVSLAPHRSITLATDDITVTDPASGESFVLVRAGDEDRDLSAHELVIDFCGSLSTEIGGCITTDYPEDDKDASIISAVIKLIGTTAGVDENDQFVKSRFE